QRDDAVEAGGAEERPVAGGVRAAALGPGLQMRRLHAQHRRLDGVHAEIGADEVMVVLRLPPVRAEQARPASQRVVVGRDETRVAEGAEILARKEREATE